MKGIKNESPIKGEFTPEELAELAKIDGVTPIDESKLTDDQLRDLYKNEKGTLVEETRAKSKKVEVPNVEEPKEKMVKVEVPKNENPQLTEALKPFRARIGSKPEKGCEKRVLAVIHKRSFDANGLMQSKPYSQYFDEREYQNFLKHPNGFVVELEIYNPFKK